MKSILVVDDSRFTYSEINEIIPPDEYTLVGHAKSGEDGIRLYEELKPDIVTLDIIMPGIDGIETAVEIIGIDSEAAGKIIMLSSLCDLDTMDEVSALGIRHFISKPIEKESLLAVLKEME